MAKSLALLPLLLLSVSLLTAEALSQPPASPPTHHHHHHHHPYHHHHHPPSPAPSPILLPIDPPLPHPHPPAAPPKPVTPPPYIPPANPPTQPPPMPSAPPPKPVSPPPKPPTHPPAIPPAKPPTPPPPRPVSPPPKPPTPSPPPLPRALIAAQGVVYCKSCKHRGANTLWDATPIIGAIVRITCKNTKYTYIQTARTDRHGYFISFLRVSNYAYGKCRVKLIFSPLSYCKKPSTLNGGNVGALLRPEIPITYRNYYQLFTVRPLAFDRKCPR